MRIAFTGTRSNFCDTFRSTRLLPVLIGALTTLTVVGCASEDLTVATPAPATQPAPSPTPSATGTPVPSKDYSYLNGVYTATLQKIQTDLSGHVTILKQQPATFSMAVVTDAKTLLPVATMTLSSSGPIGNVQFSSSTNVGLADLNVWLGAGNYRTTTSFQSLSLSIDELSDYPIAVDFTISHLKNNGAYNFDPAQSSISIKDCAFSFGSVCTVSSESARVLGPIGKQ